MTISQLVEEAHCTARMKGWHDDPRRFGEFVALVHSELSEALEAFRAGEGVAEWYAPQGKPEGIPVELADVVIRIADMCGYYGIDLEGAIAAKLRYNESRPYRHGGKTL